MKTVRCFTTQLAATCLLSICMLAVSTVTSAEQKKDFGDYEVHYSVIPTGFVPEKTASTYQITRADNRQLLNISVRKKTPEDPLNETAPQAATITGSRHDLMRPFKLSFREVREQGAIYYLSDFLIINRELSRFNIKIELESGEQFDLEFLKTLYIDK